MSRPEHLTTPNTPEGIRRINEMQAVYDKDPEFYEARERADKERQQEEQQRDYEEEQRQQ